jgi:Ni,Fe-hydrogenase III large subunit
LGADMLTARNPVSAPYEAIPELPPGDFSMTVSSRLAAGGRLIALFAVPQPDRRHPQVVAAVCRDEGGEVDLCRMSPTSGYPSLTAQHPQAQALERALWEAHGIVPEGHPWLKPLRKIDLDAPAPGDASFYRMEGKEIHEVAVGPVHAGIIEPGHFRFQCHGETVHHLEIRLGYQHRGALGFLLGKPGPRWAAVAESITGDTAVGGAIAHALCAEALAGVEAPPRAQALRAVALELERMAYHIGDLGALAGDVGFLPTAQYCGRIRGDVLNCLLTLSGSRHGRGLVRPGGVFSDLTRECLEDLSRRIAAHHSDARMAVDLLLDAPSVLARFDSTGAIRASDAAAVGLVGPAARACGLPRDVRADHPFGAYRFHHVPLSLASHGDVHARALVRSLEIDRSADLCQELLRGPPGGSVRSEWPEPLPGRLALGLVEAWRGELVHARVTGDDGQVIAAEVVDPSVRNWFGLALALRGQAISDFPLCNKSFNLAYAGHDL